MPGLYVMAILTTILALGIVAGILGKVGKREDRSLLATLFCCTLPMCALAYYTVRVPIIHLVDSIFGQHSGIALALGSTFAPLTEEPAKFWPVLIPALRRRITPQNYALCAIALGFGFGIGELWFIASVVPKGEQPWFYYFPFLNERVLVCFIHSFFTCIAINQLRPHADDEPPARPARGIALAMLLHWTLNAAIFLTIIPGVPKEVAGIVLTLWTPLFFVMAVVVLQAEHLRKWSLKELMGTAVCPECQREYPRPLFAVNLGTKRIERCPFCRRWHKV